MKRDSARDKMPNGSFWNLVDILPEVLDGRVKLSRVRAEEDET